MKKRTKIFHLFAKPKFRLIFILFLLILILIPLGLIWRHYGADENPGTKNYFTKRYIRYAADLRNNSDTDRLLTLMERGVAIGYNGIVLAPSAGQYNGEAGAAYLANAARVVAKGQALDMAVIPAHFSSHDPYYDASDKTTIQEALPVQGTRYLVNEAVDGSGNHTTTFNGDNGVTILNGDLENWSGNTPANFATDGAGTVAFRESVLANVYSGSSSLRIDNPGNSANKSTRLMNLENLTVKPNTSYTFSVWIKTDSLTNPERLSFQPYGKPGDDVLFMSYTSPFDAQGIASTQAWKQYSIVFTTQSKTQLALYLGLWNSTATGSFWIDDLALTENGMAGNLVNRASLNPVVKSEDSLTTYTQNQDYYLNGSTITVPPSSQIHADDNIRIDWYQKAIGRDPQASACYDAYFDYLKVDGLRLQSYFGNPKGYMSDYDEWRTANWDPACKALHGGEMMTGGEYMAYTFQRTYNTIREIRPDADIYVWDDMFNPYANAVDNYYSVNGTVEGSWEGLPSDVIVVNWGSEQVIDSRTNKTRMESGMKFFANQGNPQILSMSGLGATSNFLSTLDRLEAANGGISGVDGFMYTSWNAGENGSQGDFTNLEATANLIKAAGRWGAPSDVKTPTPAAVSIPSITYKDKITITGTKDDSATKIFVNGSSEGVTTNGINWSKEVTLLQGVNSVVNIVAKASGKESSDPVNLSITRHKMADANNDGSIGIADFSSLMSNWAKQETNNLADFNEDNIVNLTDFGIMMSSWGG